MITTATNADKLLRVYEPTYLLHIELQATYDSDMGRRVLVYNTVAHRNHRLPVHSVVFLLRPEADGPAMSGEWRYNVPGLEKFGLELQYQVVRLWQIPVDAMLTAPPTLLPLAPLSAVTEANMPMVINRLDERLRRETGSIDRTNLLTATYLLLGLRFDSAAADHLMEGVMELKESKTYQSVLEEGHREGLARGLFEGRVEGSCDEARRILLRLGVKRLGEPSSDQQATLQQVLNLDEIEAYIDRVSSTESWADLLRPLGAE
jgi:predicted transposase YdaD